MILSSARYTFDVPDESVTAIAELATARGTSPGEELTQAIDAHVDEAKGDDKKHLHSVGAIEDKKLDKAAEEEAAKEQKAAEAEAKKAEAEQEKAAAAEAKAK